MKKILRVLILVFSVLNIIWALNVILSIPFMSGHPMAKGYQSVDKLETILSDQPLNQVIKVEREDLERTTWYAKAQFKQSSNYIGTSLLLSLSLILTATLLFIVTFRTKQKIANQNLEPIVTTPVDKVEAQSTQAHV